MRYTPDALSFGRVPVGTSSASIPVTVTNDNPVPLNINAIALSSGDFSATRNCVGELPGGGSCEISVTFAPTAARRHQATPIGAMLEIADDAAGSRHMVRLSAIAFEAADPPEPTPLPVAIPTPAPAASATPAPAAIPTPAPAAVPTPDPLAAPAPTPDPPLATAQIYLANSACDVVDYSPGANGNIAPIAPQTALCNPSGIAVDSKGNIYVTNKGSNKDNASYTVTVYLPGSSGSAAPSATIGGSNTGLAKPNGIAVDSGGKIYVANDGSDVDGGIDSVTVYAAASTGNAAPIATISGSNTGLSGPSAIAVDSSGNIYVTNSSINTVTIYSAGSTGNVAPSATIRGYNTDLSYPSGIAVDGNRNIYVTNEYFTNQINVNSVTVYPAGSSGNAAPSATISGSNTGLFEPVGIAVGGGGKIYVLNQGGSGVTVYAAGSNGNAVPSAIIDDSVLFLTGIVAPVGLALDGSGKIYVANDAVFEPNTDVFSAANVTVYPAGSNSELPPSATIGGFSTGLIEPFGVAVDGKGNIYVANANTRSARQQYR